MGIAADSLFNALMSWVRALVNALWALFSAERTTALEFLGKNWMAVAAVIIACGLVIDWLVWLIRWQPYHLWARRVRRMLRLDEPVEEPKKEKGKAHAAVMPEKRYARPEEETIYARPQEMDGNETDEEPAWTEAVWTEPADEESAENDTLRWMQEEARRRAEAEKAERERLEKEAREAERVRREREIFEAEQARLAQEEYVRQMEEYERQRAQYERDLAEYERQKAEYEAQLAEQQAFEEEQQRIRGAESAARRRRTAVTPQEQAQYTQVIHSSARPKSKPSAHQSAKSAPAKKTAASREKKADSGHAEKAEKNHVLLSRVAKLIEPEEEELITRKTLPPRVDMNDAFRTAKLPVVTPPRSSRRKK